MNQVYKKHAELTLPLDNPFKNCKHFPSRFRGVIIGSSGSGKTMLNLKLLLSKCPECQSYFLDKEL